MLRFLKQVVWLVLLGFGVQSAWAYSLEGPIGNGPDAYQTGVIGYGLAGDLSAPKNIDQEYRRNTPIMYYACNANFRGFFGERGVDAVDQAYAILNSVTNVSQYTTDLVEYPEEAQLVNFRAAALSLTDLKSVVLGAMTEQIGLFQPTRAVWVLRIRRPGNACPLTATYDITKRNFAVAPQATPETVYSSYVNGTLYSYVILEFCNGPNPLADTVEFPVDPLATTFTAVSDYFSFWYAGLDLNGGYYTSLTRDDVAGIRYLLGTNNMNIESSGPGTFEFDTNTSPALITSQDLNLFATQARTNTAAALVALYPGLVITATSNSFALLITTNISETFTNSPFDPAGTPPLHPRFTTNYTTNVITVFNHTFGNVITNSFSPRGLVGTVTLGLTNSPFSPAGSPPTVVTNTRIFPVNGVFGDFFLLPTNLCGANILSNILTTVTATTNLPSGTNTVITTNATITFVPGSITFFTNHSIIYLPVTCPANTVARRRGIEKLTFLRRDFDSLLNQNWEPATNDYTLYAVTNGMLVPQHIRRVITAPDFLFTASDIAEFVFARNLNLNQTLRPADAAGPGTIETPTVFTFNDVGPLYFNAFLFAFTNVFFLNPPTESTQIPLFLWGSFDGSTNEPIVYPNSLSIADVERLVFSPFVVTASIPNGEVGIAYTAQFTGNGGQPPYTWSLAPGSTLPSGLNLSADGQITGTPDGPPATYDFTIRITDATTAFKDVPFAITIDP